MEENNIPQPPVFNPQNQPMQQPQQWQPGYQQSPYGVPLVKPQMGFVEAIKTVLVEKYCCFTGRARRSEYWNWILAYFILNSILSVVNAISLFSRLKSTDLSDPLSVYQSPVYIIMGLIGLALFLPNLGVTIRRLHDTGHSGWWVWGPILLYLPIVWASFSLSTNPDSFMAMLAIFGLFSMILLVIGVIILVWLCRDSDPNENEYGPSPKYQ